MMKKQRVIFGTIFLLTTYLLSACGAVRLPVARDQEEFVVQTQSQESYFEAAYTGVIEAINGSQWMINGVEVTVDPSVIQGGPFIVGDMVKVEGNVSSDGLIVVSQVLSPTASDLTGLPALGSSLDSAIGDDNDNSNENTNNNTNGDDNTNGNINDNTNDDDDDDDNTNGNINDNNNGDDDDDDNTNGNINDNNNDDDDDNTNAN
jgi:hypothetical protein